MNKKTMVKEENITKKQEIEKKGENKKEKKNENEKEKKKERRLVSGIKLEQLTIEYLKEQDFSQKEQNFSQLKRAEYDFTTFKIFLYRGEIIDKLADYLSKFAKIAEYASQHNIVAVFLSFEEYDLDLSAREKYVLGKRIDISVPKDVFYKIRKKQSEKEIKEKNEILIELKTLTGYESDLFANYFKKLHEEFTSESNIKDILWFAFFFKLNKEIVYFNKNRFPNYYLVVIEITNESMNTHIDLSLSSEINERLKDVLSEESKNDLKDYGYDYDKISEEYGFLVPVKNLLLVDTLREKVYELEEREKVREKEKEKEIQKIKREKEKEIQKVKREKEKEIQKVKREKEKEIQKVKREKEKEIQEKDKKIQEKEREIQKIKKEREKLIEFLRKKGIEFEEN